MNRISWKSVADNLVAHIPRETMQWIYDYNVKRLQDEKDVMEEFEIAAAEQTVRYMAECIAEYDLAFGPD